MLTPFRAYLTISAFFLHSTIIGHSSASSHHDHDRVRESRVLKEEESRSIYSDQIPSRVKMTNKLGRHLIVLASPTLNEGFFRHHLHAVVNFQRQLANQIIEAGDNVIILVDPALKHLYTGKEGQINHLYENGKTSQDKMHFQTQPLPDDVIVDAKIVRSLFLRDFAPVHAERPIQFKYQPLEMPKYEWKNISETFRNMTLLTGLHKLIQHHSDLILDGDNVVDNGRDTAILTGRVVYDNHAQFRKDEINLMITDGLGLKRIAIVSELTGEQLGHSARMVAFLDQQTLVVAELDTPERDRVIHELRKAYDKAPLPQIVNIRNYFDERQWDGMPAACGQYINILVTGARVYVPQFSADPVNRQAGLSPTVDHSVLSNIKESTDKLAVPVQIPDSVCRLGGSLRRMSWQLKGQMGDWLVTYAVSQSTGQTLNPDP